MSAATEVDFVCLDDGVPVVKNKLDRWFHVDAIPQEMDFHEPVVGTLDAFRRAYAETSSSFIPLKDAARDMLNHHVVGHPESECRFAQNLREAVNR